MPDNRVVPVKRNQYLSKVSGPRPLASGKKDFFATKTGEVVLKGRSVSTYPRSRSAARQGDPVADRYSALIYENRTVLALADGCNWGVRPLEAADRSVNGLLGFMSTVQNKIKTTREAAMYLRKGLQKAHERIIEGKKDMFLESATSTLLGAITLELKGGPSKWAVVAVGVGESKLFLYSNKTRQVTDITAGNRRDISDWRDPGGRLGPYVDGGQPDLRNLRYYYAPCEENDILLLLTDGVHDNFHPYYLGKSVKDTNLASEGWDKFAADHESGKIVDSCIAQAMSELLNQVSPTPVSFVNQLIRYSLESTKKLRTLLTNPKAKPPPSNSVEYPGKLDHATAIAVQLKFIDADVPVNEHETSEWQVFVPKNSPPEKSAPLGIIEELLEQLSKKDPQLVEQLQKQPEEEFLEYYVHLHSPKAIIRVSAESGEVRLLANTKHNEFTKVNTWVVGEGIPISAISSKRELFRSLKESVTSNIAVSKQLPTLLAKFEGVQPAKDTVQLRGKRREYRFADFGGAFKTLSGSLTFGTAEVELIGENEASLGSYHTLYLWGAKADYISELVSKETVTSALQTSDWFVASVAELLCRILGGTAPSPSTSAGSLASST